MKDSEMNEKDLSARLERMLPVEIKYEGNDAVMLAPEAWEETRKGIVLLYNKLHYPEYDGLLCERCYGLPNEGGECPRCF